MLSFLKNRRAKRAGITTCLSIPFLFLYLAGTVELDSFHGLFHANEESTLHSLQQENNSCHNAIYHQKKNNVCHHTAHITQFKKCPLCHVAFHSFHLSSVRFSAEPLVSSENIKEKYLLQQVSAFAARLSSRGPPVNS